MRQLDPTTAGADAMARLFERVARLERQGEGWQAPSYAGTWADYGTGFRTGRYTRVAGRVWIEGLVKTTANITPASTIFTLPAGYHPAQQVVTSQWCGIGASQGVARVDVLADGTVQFNVQATGLATAPFTVSFVGIHLSFSLT